MSRVPRSFYESGLFHIVCQGFEKKFVFKDDCFKEKYFNLLKEYKSGFNVEILSYCIMDNHVHILLLCNSIKEMSKFMQNVNTRFALYYNDVNERVGYVFRDRFLSEPIKNKEHLFSCISYIHYNPVVAGISKDLSSYKYSSYNDFFNKTNFINDKILMIVFGCTESYIDSLSFIHSSEGYGIDIKNDKPRLKYEKAKAMIEKIMFQYDFYGLEKSSTNIKVFFFKQFLREGVTIYSIEKFFGIDHKTIKGIIRSINKGKNIL